MAELFLWGVFPAHLPGLEPMIIVQDFITALTIWQTQKGNSMVFLSPYNNGTLHLYSTFNLFSAFSCLLLGLTLMKQNSMCCIIVCATETV